MNVQLWNGVIGDAVHIGKAIALSRLKQNIQPMCILLLLIASALAKRNYYFIKNHIPKAQTAQSAKFTNTK